jgi:hypothetical protein
MWRDADTDARDLKSNALISRDVRDQIDWLLKGAEKLCSESVGYSAPRRARLRRGARCTEETFTIRLPMRLVNAEMRTSFVGHHISATSSCAAASSRPQPAGSSAATALTTPSTARSWSCDGRCFFAEIIVGSAAKSRKDLGEFWRDDTREIQRVDHRPNTGRLVMDLATEDRLNTRDTCGGTTADMGADVLQRGVSDHIRGRALGRRRGHLGWSLTPRNWHWRPHGQCATRRAAQNAAR